MELHRQAPRGSIDHGLGLKLDEPPIILGPEDETFIKGNMIFSIKINTIVPEFGAIKIGKDIIIPPNA
jgi:Xaa-Pro aminopeptidase